MRTVRPYDSEERNEFSGTDCAKILSSLYPDRRITLSYLSHMKRMGALIPSGATSGYKTTKQQCTEGDILAACVAIFLLDSGALFFQHADNFKRLHNYVKNRKLPEIAKSNLYFLIGNDFAVVTENPQSAIRLNRAVWCFQLTPIAESLDEAITRFIAEYGGPKYWRKLPVTVSFAS